MRLQDLTWMDVDRYLEADNRVILVTGATEQHAYLSLMTDILIPAKIADAVGKREGVLVAPPLNFGVSAHFSEYPGTISLSQETFNHVLREIIESMSHQGFRGFFILNGHGGNKMPDFVRDLEEANEIRILWYDWWRSSAARAFADRYNLSIQHANWGENFPFNRVRDVPRGEKPLVNIELADGITSLRDVLGDGCFGGPYQVDDELMYMLYDEVVTEAARMVRGLAE